MGLFSCMWSRNEDNIYSPSLEFSCRKGARSNKSSSLEKEREIDFILDNPLIYSSCASGNTSKYLLST